MKTGYWVGLGAVAIPSVYFLYQHFQPSKYTVNFIVRSDSSPVVGADVWLEKADAYGRHLITDSNGFVSFRNLSIGTHSYRVAATGYYEDTGTLWVGSDMGVPVWLEEAIIPVCTEGEYKCIGFSRYLCQNNQWILYEQNSPACGYEPPPSDTFSIGLYYLWHYPEDNPATKNWLQEYSAGLDLGLGRLSDFMAQNDYVRDIVYESAGELYTTAEIGKSLHFFGEPGTPESGVLIQPVMDALTGLCSIPQYQTVIQSYDLVYIVLANMMDIFGPLGRDTDLAHTRRSPIYIGGRVFNFEAATDYAIIEMEFFVTCGVPELREDPGEPTIMYPGYLVEHPGEIMLRPHELELAKWSNWQKGEYGVDFCNRYMF